MAQDAQTLWKSLAPRLRTDGAADFSCFLESASARMAAVGAASLQEFPRGEGVLRVTTYNILAPVWVNEQHYKGINPATLDEATRRRILLERLLELESDVVFMQEVQKTFLDALLDDGAETPLGSIYEVTFCPYPPTFWSNWLTEKTNHEPRENGVAVWTRRTAVEKEKMDFVPVDLPEWQDTLPAHALGARACYVWAKVAAWGEAGRVLLVTSHFDADSSQRAALQCGELCQKIKTSVRAEAPLETTVIWGGDFNMLMEHDAITALGKEGFRPVSQGPEPSAFFIELCGEAGSRIDHVLVKDDDAAAPNATVKAVAAFVPHCPCTCATGQQRQEWALATWGSDHLPVTVDLQRGR